MTDTTTPDDGGEFGGARDHLADLPDVIIPADQFEALLSSIDTPDPAPALADAAARPRRFTTDHAGRPITPGYVSVEMTEDPGDVDINSDTGPATVETGEWVLDRTATIDLTPGTDA